nr:MAG TPA: hypothetical protein [Caudoviricetes sp.]
MFQHESIVEKVKMSTICQPKFLMVDKNNKK